MSAAALDWMMIERFVFRRDDAESFPDEGDAPFRAQGSTSQGDVFTVALRVLKPPEISRLYLQWPLGPDPNIGSSCDLIAAHGNLLLLRLTSGPVASVNKDESPIYPQEHFICSRSASAPPSLKPHKIPMCTTPVLLRGNKDKVISAPRSFPSHAVGILCRGAGGEQQDDFAIAQLRVSRPNHWEAVEAELCVLRSSAHSSDHQWELEEHIPIQVKCWKDNSDLAYWRTDQVVPFKNSLLWVDYCIAGILFCDVFQTRPAICYLPLPVGNRNAPGYEVRPFQDFHRSVCVTKDGRELNFIDVVRDDGLRVGPMSPGTGFVVEGYALRTTESCGPGSWDKVFSVKSSELVGIETGSPLTFPLVSIDNENIVHFILSEKVWDGIDKVSVVTINVSAKEVVSVRPYIKGLEDLKGEDSDMIKQKSRILQSFISSELPKCLYPTSSSKGVYREDHQD